MKEKEWRKRLGFCNCEFIDRVILYNRYREMLEDATREMSDDKIRIKELNDAHEAGEKYLRENPTIYAFL